MSTYHIMPEQEGWTHLWRNHEVIQKHTAIVRYQALNSYSPFNLLGGHWKKGDLICHFAGCGQVFRPPNT